MTNYSNPQPEDSDQPARTAGEWFMKILQGLGVKYVFGTSGGATLDIKTQ